MEKYIEEAEESFEGDSDGIGDDSDGDDSDDFD